MKKLLILTISLITLLLIITTTCYADDVEYSISQYTINADIEADGGVNVTEYLSYKFEGSANGIYRDIDIKNPDNMLYSASSINDINVFEGSVIDDDMIEYKKGIGENGSRRIYELIKTKNGIRVKIYCPAEDEEKRFIIQYHLANAVVKYGDTADFYWNFIGGEWANSINNISIVVTIPKPSEELRVYSHGPYSGNNSIVDMQTIQYTNNYLEAGNTVSIRLLFPKSLITGSAKFINKNMKSLIIKEEAEAAKKANIDRQNSVISIVLAVLWPLAAIILFIIIYRLYGRNKKSYYGIMKEPPGNYGPSFTQYLLSYSYIGPTGLTAEIMHLIKKKFLYLEVLPEDSSSKGQSNYKICLTDHITGYDFKHEGFLINWFINEIGDGKSVSFRAIKEYSKKHPREFSNSLREFKAIIRDEAASLGLMELKTSAYKMPMMFFIFSIITGLYLGITFKMYEAMIFAILSSSIVFILSLLVKKPTIELSLEKEKWISYKKYLKSFTGNSDNVDGGLFFWETALIYTIIFGFHNDAIKGIKNSYPYGEYSSSSLTYLHSSNGGIDSFSNSINSSITNFSSTTGLSGGGSSAGGTGGGGGGGGAF